MIKAIHLTNYLYPYGGGELLLEDLINTAKDIKFQCCINTKKIDNGYKLPIPTIDISTINPSSIQADVMFFWGNVENAPNLFPQIPIKIKIAVSDFDAPFIRSGNQYATHAIALSHSTKEALQFHGECRIIHAGIDFSRQKIIVEREKIREALGFTKDDFVVGQFCRMVKFKNFEGTIEAIAPMNSNIKLLVIGTGENLFNVLDLCEKKLAKRHQYIRYLNIEQIGTYYNCIDAFCLPSKGEGFARVQWESMYFYNPFIGTPVGGVPDIIEHGINGFIVHNKEDIQDAIRKLSNDRDYLQQVADNAHKCAVEKGSMELTASKISNFIKEIQKRAACARIKL